MCQLCQNIVRIPAWRVAEAIRHGTKVDGRTLLDERQTEFTTLDIAWVLGKKERVIRYHCNKLFGHRSRYILNRDEAGRLIDRVLRTGYFKRKN
jgi:hypothetical protein